MSEQSNTSAEQSIVESVLRLPDIQDLAANFLDAGIDSLVDNEALEVIPVVRTIRGLAHGVAGFREARFTQKLLKLLVELGPADHADTERWDARFRDEPKETGARVLDIVDRVTALRKVELIAGVTRLYLDGECDRTMFLRTVEMIEKALTEDLEALVRQRGPIDSIQGMDRLIAVGLAMDRSAALLLQSSQPATRSQEGELLQRAVNIQ